MWEGNHNFTKAEAIEDFWKANEATEAPKDPTYPKGRKVFWRWCAIILGVVAVGSACRGVYLTLGGA